MTTAADQAARIEAMRSKARAIMTPDKHDAFLGFLRDMHETFGVRWRDVQAVMTTDEAAAARARDVKNGLVRFTVAEWRDWGEKIEYLKTMQNGTTRATRATGSTGKRR